MSTADGAGPVRLTGVSDGSATVPPSKVTLAAPAAVAPSSVSAVAPSLNSDMNRLADEPAGSVEPDGAPSTKTLVILIPLTTVCVPAEAAWNSSVGAPLPAFTSGDGRHQQGQSACTKEQAASGGLAEACADHGEKPPRSMPTRGMCTLATSVVAWQSTTGRRNRIGSLRAGRVGG